MRPLLNLNLGANLFWGFISWLKSTRTLPTIERLIKSCWKQITSLQNTRVQPEALSRIFRGGGNKIPSVGFNTSFKLAANLKSTISDVQGTTSSTSTSRYELYSIIYSFMYQTRSFYSPGGSMLLLGVVIGFRLLQRLNLWCMSRRIL